MTIAKRIAGTVFIIVFLASLYYKFKGTMMVSGDAWLFGVFVILVILIIIVVVIRILNQ